MRFFASILLTVILLTMPRAVVAQQHTEDIKPMLSAEPSAEKSTPKVTSVYGVTAEDYLPSIEVARKHLRPNVRGAASRPSFDLPDAFYFIGGPVFLLILLRVLVIFLNGFEEKRKEEMRAAASQSPNTELSSWRRAD